MNHIKLFEELNIGEPQIGDWVICKDLAVNADDIDEINNFLEKNHGKAIGDYIDKQRLEKITQWIK